VKVKASALKAGDTLDLGDGKIAVITSKIAKTVEIPARKRKVLTLSVDVKNNKGPLPTAGFDQFVVFGDQEYKVVVEKSSRMTRFKAWASGWIPWRSREAVA